VGEKAEDIQEKYGGGEGVVNIENKSEKKNTRKYLGEVYGEVVKWMELAEDPVQ
jgi:hypothetical protein